MNKRKKDVRWLTGAALMAAIVILLASTPLGMIQLPLIKATTVHIPVILGAIVLGPMAGAILGGVFGVCSIISNTIAPTVISFAFSPFLSMSGIPGAVKAVWIAVGCRVLIGVIAGWVWILLKKCNVPVIPALSVTGFLGSMVNTVFVMGSIYLLLVQEYAAAKSIAVDAVWGFILATIFTSGVGEAIAAAVLVALIGRILLKLKIGKNG